MELVTLDLLEMAEPAVERGTDGLPHGWPLLRAGDNYLTVDGRPVNLKLSEDDLEAIAGYHKSKGVKIPLDSVHVLSNLAGKLKIDESELARRLPRLGGVAGFGDLKVSDSALCLCDVEWNELGAEVMRHDQIRYYSPTIRGLDGKSPLRITSVALTNSPRLNNLPSLAASEDEEETPITPDAVREAIQTLTNPKEASMPDPVTPSTAAKPPAAPPEAGKENEKEPELLALLREVLGDDVTPANLKVKLAALKSKADATAELSESVKSLQLAEERRNLTAIREKCLAEGSLTPEKLAKPFFQSMTAAELAEYHEAMKGTIVPTGVLELGDPIEKPAAAPKHYNTTAEALAAAPVKTMEA